MSSSLAPVWREWTRQTLLTDVALRIKALAAVLCHLTLSYIKEFHVKILMAMSKATRLMAWHMSNNNTYYILDGRATFSSGKIYTPYLTTVC